MSLPTVFVCGVTGIQGGSVARQLRSEGAEVHALVRNVTSINAKEIEALGVKLWPGDYDNAEALNSAMAGCSAVFLNFMPDFNDTSAELRWARSIIAAAHATGAKHILYSSGLGINSPERMQNWDSNLLAATFILSKQSIEKETRNAGFEYWTILRPGNFMTNYIHPHVFMYPKLVEHGILETASTTDTILPTVDRLTIGRFASAAFMDPVKFHAQEVALADELLTLDTILAKYSATAGRTLKAIYLTDEEIETQKPTNPFIQGQLLMRDMVQFIDMEKVKSWGVPLSSLDAFLEKEKDHVLATYQRTE